MTQHRKLDELVLQRFARVISESLRDIAKRFELAMGASPVTTDTQLANGSSRGLGSIVVALIAHVREPYN